MDEYFAFFPAMNIFIEIINNEKDTLNAITKKQRIMSFLTKDSTGINIDMKLKKRIVITLETNVTTVKHIFINLILLGEDE